MTDACSSSSQQILEDFCIERVCAIIGGRAFKRAVLQFPDDLLGECVEIYRQVAVRLAGSAEVYIAADSSYGSSVDDISALHVDGDVLVYFGDDLSSSGVVPVIVVPRRKVMNTQMALSESIAPLLAAAGDNTQHIDILLLYEPGYAHYIEELVREVAMTETLMRATLVVGSLPRCADLDRWDLGAQTDEIEIVGGLLFPREHLDLPAAVIWYIGDKREQLSASLLRLPNYPVISFSPVHATVSVSVGRDTKEFQERYGGVCKVKDAEIIGVIVGSMGLGEGTTNALVGRLQKLIIASGRKYYTFVMGRLNEAKLCNFPEIDLYCFISNEDEAMIKPKTFHVPVLTPFELELGLGAHDWSAKYLSSSCGEYAGKNIEELVHRLELMHSSGAEDFSSVDDDNSESVDIAECSEENSSILTKRNDQNQLTVFHSAAAARFLERGYHGLEYAVPRDQDLSVKQGQFGIAASYDKLRSSGGNK